jgi:hypothetical protein
MSMVKSVIKMVWSVIRRVELSQPTISKTGQTDISSCSSGQSFISRVSSVSHLGRPAFNRVRSVSVGQSQCWITETQQVVCPSICSKMLREKKPTSVSAPGPSK